MRIVFILLHYSPEGKADVSQSLTKEVDFQLPVASEITFFK